jgi:hypothetical protein
MSFELPLITDFLRSCTPLRFELSLDSILFQFYKSIPIMKFESVLYAAATLGIASAHSIMNKVNNNGQGVGIYMPSDDSVY